MVACARLSYAKMPVVIQRVARPRRSLWGLLLTGALIMVLMSVILLPCVVAETTSAPRSNSPEQVTGSPRRGIVTTMANLRASPSMQSEVVATIKDGMPVEILMETERWYRVKSEEGLEAWIGKSLVLVEPAPRKKATAVPRIAVQPEIKDSPASAPVVADAATVSGERRSEDTVDQADQQDLAFSLAISEDAPSLSPEGVESSWSIDAILPYVQRLEAYVIPALIGVLILSIALHFRAAWQLRRAMQEMELILNIVEEIYANGMLARSGGSGAMQKAMPRGTTPSESPVIEFSSVERAVLQAMSDQREVQEGELTKILAEKGFASVLVKAVIGNILRKTRATGLPWVNVRYIQGRYRYQLRSEGVSDLSEG